MSNSSTEIQKITIDRREWFNGSHIQVQGKAITLNSALWLRDKNCGCCLGHFLKQIDGLHTDHIAGYAEPCEVKYHNSLSEFPGFGSDLITKHWASKAIDINDNRDLSNEVREKMLIELFKENGYELEFINEGPVSF